MLGGFESYQTSYFITDEARQYVGGITWHAYEGPYEIPESFHNKYPDLGKHQYMYYNKESCLIKSIHNCVDY